MTIPAIPVTASNIISWVRQAATAINLLAREVNSAGGVYLGAATYNTYVSTSSGWANYTDTAAAQSISASTRTQLTINAGAKDETQKPSDVTAYWDATNNLIPGYDGDAIVVRLRLTVTPSDSSASRVFVEFDIGGAIGVLDSHSFTLADGAGVAQPLSLTVAMFNRATFAANGCKIYVTCDGPASISGKGILVQRTHKAR